MRTQPKLVKVKTITLLFYRWKYYKGSIEPALPNTCGRVSIYSALCIGLVLSQPL